MDDLILRIDGDPVIQERPRKARHSHFYDPSARKKQVLGLAMLAARTQLKRPVCTGPIAIGALFYTSGKRGDLDNMIKALLDAGNGILWDDDKQVISIEAHVYRDAESPRTELSIKEVQGE